MKSASSSASLVVSADAVFEGTGGDAVVVVVGVLRPFGFLRLALRGAGALLWMMASARQSRRMV